MAEQVSQSRRNAETAVRPTRRAILRAAAALALTPAAGGLGEDHPPRVAAAARIEPPWWLAPEYPQSLVIEVREAAVLDGERPDETVIRRMLRAALAALTENSSLRGAWSAILKGAERVAIKFNQVGADVLGTSAALTRVLVDDLAKAGWSRANILLVEAPPHVAEELETPRATAAWGEGIPIGDEIEPVAEWVRRCDAIIDVPFLKTHQFAGMSGALKNLSHAVVKHPARYHANGCTPFVADIVGQPLIASRLRLVLANAIRLVIRNGPDATPADVQNYGGLLLARDPVAADSVARSILDRERAALRVGPPLAVPYLDDAIRRRLGRGMSPEVTHRLISGA